MTLPPCNFATICFNTWISKSAFPRSTPIRQQNNTNLDERVTFLRNVALFDFQGMDDQTLLHLAEDFRERTYRGGDVIFHQGDDSRNLSIVLEGKVRIYHLTPSGEETTMAIFAPGRLVGEFSLIDSEPRSATAQAIGPCTLLEISSERCLHYLTHVSGLALSMCRILTRKTRWTSMVAETIARLDAAGRLLHLLLEYNDEFGVRVEAADRTHYVLDLGLNQSDLATLVGVDRPWVSTVLNKWRKRGLLEFKSGTITVLDLDAVIEEHRSRSE